MFEFNATQLTNICQIVFVGPYLSYTGCNVIGLTHYSESVENCAGVESAVVATIWKRIERSEVHTNAVVVREHLRRLLACACSRTAQVSGRADNWCLSFSREPNFDMNVNPVVRMFLDYGGGRLRHRDRWACFGDICRIECSVPSFLPHSLQL